MTAFWEKGDGFKPQIFAALGTPQGAKRRSRVAAIMKERVATGMPAALGSPRGRWMVSITLRSWQIPGFAITIAVCAFSLLRDGLRGLVEPVP